MKLGRGKQKENFEEKFFPRDLGFLLIRRILKKSSLINKNPLGKIFFQNFFFAFRALISSNYYFCDLKISEKQLKT